MLDGLTIELTDACNLGCSLCCHGPSQRADATTGIERDRLREILDRVECRDVWLTGGEPCLYPDLAFVLEYLKRRGSRTTLISNATLIDSEFAAMLVQSGLDMAVLSVDGLPRVHDCRRGRQGVFDLVEAAVWAIGSRIPIRINTVLCPIEAEAPLELIPLVAKWPIQSLSIAFLEWSTPEEIHETKRVLSQYWSWIPADRDLPVPQSQIATPSVHDWSQLVATCVAQGSEWGLKVTCSSPFATRMYAGSWLTGRLSSQVRVCCKSAHRNALRLNSSGEFIFCGSLRKRLGPDPLRDAQDLSARLHKCGLAPICMRCCKIAVVEEYAIQPETVTCS